MQSEKRILAFLYLSTAGMRPIKCRGCLGGDAIEAVFVLLLLASPVGQGHKAAAAHFTAEAGNVYYFRVKNTWVRESGTTARISLKPLDSDEGLLLASKFSLSTSHPKK